MTLEDLLREGARELIEKAVGAELAELLGSYENVRTLRGQQALVRNGYLPEREIMTAVGPVSVRIPKVRDRSRQGVKFNSLLVPPYVRRSKSLSAALPRLYLKGISTGEMGAALEVLVGEGAKGLSPAVVSRLKAQWGEEYGAWRKRDLAEERYVYWWADGIYSSLQSEDERLCLLMAETRQQAYAAFERFIRTYEAKYPKAVEKLLRDRETLLAYYDFPAEHWQHIRSTNPIESTFATIRHRSNRTKNCVSRNTLLGLVYRLAREAEKGWQRIRGFERIEAMEASVVFKDGTPVTDNNDNQQLAA